MSKKLKKLQKKAEDLRKLASQKSGAERDAVLLLRQRVLLEQAELLARNT